MKCNLFLKSGRYQFTPFFISLYSFLVFCLFIASSPSLAQGSGEESDTTALFALKGKTINAQGKPIAQVTLDLKKKNQSILKIESGKNGKFSLDLEINTKNSQDEYTLHVSKEGMVSKTLNINTYIPKNEFMTHAYEQYDFFLELLMLDKVPNEKVVTKHSGTIRWNTKAEKFVLDDVQSKVAPKEEDAITLSPPPVTEIEPPLLPMQMESNQNNNPTPSKDSVLPEISSASTIKEEAKEVQITTVNIHKRKNDITKNSEFDPSYLYNVTIEKRLRQEQNKKRLLERSRNTSTKYETSNILTSMLNTVDAFHKK